MRAVNNNNNNNTITWRLIDWLYYYYYYLYLWEHTEIIEFLLPDFFSPDFLTQRHHIGRMETGSEPSSMFDTRTQQNNDRFYISEWLKTEFG